MKNTAPIGMPPQAPQGEAEPEEELDVTEEEEEEEEEEEDVDVEADEEDEEVDEGSMHPCAPLRCCRSLASGPVESVLVYTAALPV